MYGLFNICAFYYSKGWLRVYYGLDLLLSKLSKAQVAESSVSGTPSLFPIGSLAELLIPIVYCFISNMFFKIAKRRYQDCEEIKKMLCGPLICIALHKNPLE
jgi:hypothetical protein